MRTEKKANTPSKNRTRQSATSKPNHTSKVDQTNEQKATVQAEPLQSPPTSNIAGQSPDSKTNPKSVPFPLVLFLFTALLIAIFGIPLQIVGLLPSEFVGIASGFVVLIGLIFTFWQIGVTELLVRLLKAFWLRPVMWISVAITALVLASVIIGPQIYYHYRYSYQPGPTYQYETPTSSPI